MGALSVAIGGKANQGGGETFTRSEQNVHPNAALSRVFRALSPRKTWLFVAERLGLSERVAKQRLACDREYSAAEIAVMLQSEEGLSFLSAIMADSTPRWWSAFKQQVAIKDARRLERAARRRLQEAIDADADLTAAIERADSLLVSDADFYRPHADALGALNRAPHRAVVKGRQR